MGYEDCAYPTISGIFPPSMYRYFYTDHCESRICGESEIPILMFAMGNEQATVDCYADAAAVASEKFAPDKSFSVYFYDL
jgi:hypothetical protein